MRRARRVLAVLVVALLGLIALLGLAAFVYNAVVPFRTQAAQALYPGPFVEVGGREVAYRSWGTHGSPILLVPGFAEPTFVFERLGRRLGRTHVVYAVDLAGFGYTERKGPYGLTAWADELQAFMRHFRIVRPVVAGHSLGAAVAVELAARGSARGAVLIDGDALDSGGPPGWARRLLVDPYRTAAFRLAVGSDWLIRDVLHSAYGPSGPPVTKTDIEAWRRPFHVTGAESALWQLSGNGIPGFTLTELRQKRIRALVLWGDHDSLDQLTMGRRAAAALGAPIIVLKDGGHLTQVTHAADVTRAIDAFAR